MCECEDDVIVRSGMNDRDVAPPSRESAVHLHGHYCPWRTPSHPGNGFAPSRRLREPLAVSRAPREACEPLPQLPQLREHARTSTLLYCPWRTPGDAFWPSRCARDHRRSVANVSGGLCAIGLRPRHKNCVVLDLYRTMNLKCVAKHLCMAPGTDVEVYNGQPWHVCSCLPSDKAALVRCHQDQLARQLC